MANNLSIGIEFDVKKLSTAGAKKVADALEVVKQAAEETGAVLSKMDYGQRQLDKYNKQLDAIAKKRDALQAELAGSAATFVPDLGDLPQKTEQTTRQFNQLGFSIQQVARELPAFTYSASTGFMAISNNIPMLADAIQQLRKENEFLAASGQKTVPVWKQVARSLLSWQTAMSVGITLLTVYGAQIVEYLSKQLSFGKTVDANAESQKQLNDAWKTGVENAQKELTSLKVLYSAATDDTRSRKERLDAVKQLQTEYPAYFENLSNESVMAGDAADAYTRLAQSLTDAAIARASMDKMTENATKLLDLKDQKEALEKQLAPAKALRDQLMNTPIIGEGGATGLNNSIIRVARLESSLKSVTSEIDALNAANEKLSKGINVSSLTGGGKGSTSKDLNTNLATIGGLTNKINELKEAQGKASAEQAVNLEKEIRMYQERLNLLQRTIAVGANGRLADSNYKNTITASAIPGVSAQAAIAIPITFEMSENQIRENLQRMRQMFSDSIKEMTVFSGEQITGLVTQSFASLGDAIGSGNALEALKSSLIMVMDMLQQFGSALIAAGVASEALKAVAWSGIGAIIAGGALVAATAAAKAALQNATAFANGGIVSGPTLALVGEYGGARNNPEVIAPLDKLRSLIQPAGFNTDGLYLETKVRGKDLYVALQSVEHERRRVR